MAWLPLLSLAGLLLALAYSLLIGQLLKMWFQCPECRLPEGWQPQTSVSIILPARDEARHIKGCLQSLLQQHYPRQLFEIIVVDDYSADETAAVVRAMASPNLRLLSLAAILGPEAAMQSSKKKALEVGIAHAHGRLIVTTDADCKAPQQWLRQIAFCYESTGAKAVAAPVLLRPVHNALERFQALDFVGTMLVTAAGNQGQLFFLANGANLAYEKTAFEAAGGFSGNEQFASGDDVFLIQKIAGRYPGQISFAKSPAAAMYSLPQTTWQGFLSQRLRWGTKNHSYDDWRITALVGLVFLYSWLILASLFLLPWYPLFGTVFFLGLFLAKAMADYALLSIAARFFGQRKLLRGFLRSECLHILYIAIVGLLALVIKKYQWKGRQVR